MAYNESLTAYLPDDNDDFTPSFRDLIYSHLTFFRSSYADKMMSVKPFDAYRFRGDLYGLLKREGLSNKMIWVTAMVNGFDDPTMYDGQQTQFIVVPGEAITLLERRHKSIDSSVK